MRVDLDELMLYFDGELSACVPAGLRPALRDLLPWPLYLWGFDSI